MKKRILAVVCMLAVLVGIFAVGGVAATTDTDDRYDVGYAKRDVNPWVKSSYVSVGIEDTTYSDSADNITTISIRNPSNTTQSVTTSIVKVPLAGYGNSSSRLTDGIFDDNGDGIETVGDGLAVTATSVTDDWGKTVIYLTMDSIGAYSKFVKAVRAGIVAELTTDVVSESDIMVSASHCHEAPDLDLCAAAEDGTALKAYYDYYVEQAIAAAVEAYESRSAADMHKGSIVASDYMKENGYTYTSGDLQGEGYQLNFVRHYVINDGESTWVGGDNFGSPPAVGEETDWELEHVSEANDTMNILQFTRDEGDPVVLIQWQAHPSIMGATTRTDLSSDYVNALRYRLENNATEFGGSTNYCVGFWQGTGGNINPTSRDVSEYIYDTTNNKLLGWPSVSKDFAQVSLSYNTGSDPATETNREYRNALYGYLLGKIALDCLDSEEMTAALDMSNIRTIQSVYDVPRQKDSEGLIAAANAWQADVDEGNTPTYPYVYNWSEDGNNYVLNSAYHAQRVLFRASSNLDSTQMELNALVLGENVAMVVAPPELFDRYSVSNTVGNTADNDWLDLVDNDTYGTPFVLSKSNDRMGYLPNYTAYEYYTDSTGTIDPTSQQAKMGSYEANSALHAQGAGEEVVAKLKAMLEMAAQGYDMEGTCPVCGEVKWQPVTDTTITEFGTGHFYLTEDLLRPGNGSANAKQKVIYENETVCLNLNGHVIETEGRTFNVKGGGVLNIIDTPMWNEGSGGTVRAYSGANNPNGGVVTIASDGTMNVYGGTLEFVPETASGDVGTGCGGIVSLSGTLNMHGGTIKGAKLVDSSSSLSKDGCGGAVYMWGGSLNMYGGTITSGTVPETVDDGAKNGMGPCVYIGAKTCRVRLYNDAKIDDIFYGVNSGYNVAVYGKYTGSAGLSFHSDITPAEDLDVGQLYTYNSVAADISEANLFCTNMNTFSVEASGNNLVLKISYADNVIAAVGTTGYTSLQQAVDAYDGTAIKMIRDESSAVTVNEGKDIYLDLNGCKITGKVTVSAYTLYCKDSATDDYTVSDGVYGKIQSHSGNIAGIPESSDMADDGYMMISEDGVLSFHRVNLDLTHMTLRPITNSECAPSVYYTSDFMGDEMVAAKVLKYGVALSVDEMPDETNMADCHCSYFESFTDGAVGNSANGTLLKGIMKPTNATLVNRRNANLGVFGRAYILTEDGYMFGGGYERDLIEQTVAIDNIWTTLSKTQKEGMVTMFNTYKSIVKDWEVPNLKSAVDPANDGITKILGIGNSYTMDCMWLLGQIYAAENPDKNIQLGIAYISGGTLQGHASRYENNQNLDYFYFLDCATGTWTREAITLADAIAYTGWDIVSLQQGSTSSVDPSTYDGNIQFLQNCVSSGLGYTPKFFWNLTWSWPIMPLGTKLETLEQQTEMFEQVVSAVQQKIVPDETFEMIMPAGVAIQNANSVLEDADLYCDNVHLGAYGRLIAGYVLYCQLENVDADALTALKVTATPSAFSKIHTDEVTGAVDHSAYMNIALEAVRYALITGRAGTFASTDLTDLVG